MADHHHYLLPPIQSPSISSPPAESHDSTTTSSLNINVAVLIAAVICALLCALGLNSMLQCVLQCTYRAFTRPVKWFANHQMNSGLKKKEVVALPISTHTNSAGSTSSSSCAICLLEFSDGEEIRVLPKCNHKFHVGCIDKWLLSHSSCPTCRLYLKSSSCSSCLDIVAAL